MFFLFLTGKGSALENVVHELWSSKKENFTTWEFGSYSFGEVCKYKLYAFCKKKAYLEKFCNYLNTEVQNKNWLIQNEPNAVNLRRQNALKLKNIVLLGKKAIRLRSFLLKGGVWDFALSFGKCRSNYIFS